MAKQPTEYHKFRGLAAWTRLFPGQQDSYNGIEFYKMNFYPSKETLEGIQKLGGNVKVKEDDGTKSGVEGKYIVLKRKLKGTFNGVSSDMKPPRVEDPDGNEYDTKIRIGNGSTVEITLERYWTSHFGWQFRLFAVKVIELIEYIAPEAPAAEAEESEVEVVEENGKKKVRW